MILRRLVLALLVLLLPLAAQAQSPDPQIAGAWDLRADGATVFRFEIEQAANGEWRGRWHRPQSFNSDGNAFYNIRGGSRDTASMTGLEVGDTVELGFDDPRPGAIPDIFSFRLTGPDSAEMLYVGTDLAPYVLVRAGREESLGPWDASRIYRRITPADGPASAAGPQAARQIDFARAASALAPRREPEAAPEPEAEPAPQASPDGGRIEADFLEGF